MLETKSDKARRPSLYEQGMTSEERGVVYGCFNEGLKVNEIQAVWSRLISRDPLSNRQLYLYRERWVNAGRKNEIDETVVWSDRQAFARWHIQSSHLHMLNDIDNWLADSFIGFLPRPTYRYLYWCSYVLSVAPELQDELDVFLFGTQLYLRDIAYSYSQSASEFTDLEQLLSYRPWRSGQKQERYQAAQIRGDVSRLKEVAPVLTSRDRESSRSSAGVVNTPRSIQTAVYEHQISVPIGRQMLFLGMVQNMCLDSGFDLPSVKVKNLKSKGINPIEKNFYEESGSIVRIRY